MSDLTITNSNAYDYYSRYRRGEIELSKAQVAQCESYLTDEEMDEINYSEEVRENDAASKINTKNEDGEVVDDNGNGAEWGAVGGSAVATGGTLALIIAGIEGSSKLANANGFCAIACAIASMAGAAAALIQSLTYDQQLKDRTAKSEQSAQDNQTIDGYTDALGGTMEMMAEDEKLYQEQREQATLARNEQTSRAAELQMQIDTATAMGDTAGAEKAKAELQQLKQTDNSAMEEDLAETQGAIAEYGAMAAEAEGVKESGQTVSSFLKAGHPKATLAYVNATLCGIGAAAAGLAVLFSAIPKIWTPFGPVDAAAGMAASIIFLGVGAALGTSAGTYIKKGGEERQCGNNGDGMDEHIGSLDEMIKAQKERTEATSQVFAEADKAGKEAEDGAENNAGDAIDQNNNILNPKEEEQPA